MKRHLKILTGVAVLMAMVVVVPVAQAAPLLSRVNQAMRSAGISVTRVNQIGWGEGVVTGHYKTYQHLVEAMKWHKQQGRVIPDSSKFGKGVAAVASVSGQTKCRTGNVLSLSKSQVTITKAGGNVRISLTSKQYDTAVGRSIMTGNQVKACSKNNFKSLIGNLTKLSDGDANEGGGGGGGGDSSSSGT